MNKEFYDKYQKDLDCGSCPSLTNCISDTTPQCLLGTSFYLEDLVDQLKQQLAEKDCRIEELEGQFAYECECNKQLVELQKQLAEKDKEIESLKQQLEETNAGYDFTYEQSVETIKELKQNQTQLAIQELEKVKKVLAEKLLEDFCNSWQYNQRSLRGHRHIEYYDLIQGIDNQIKELKGE